MKTILCYGDSNTWGYNPESDGARFPLTHRWPGLLQEALGASWYVLEEGLCGRTAVVEDPLMPGRRGIEFLPVCLDTHDPVDLCILMLGTNDLKTRFNLSPQEITKAMGLLLDVIIPRVQQVLLIAPAPLAEKLNHVEFMPRGPVHSRRLSPLYRVLARDRGVHFLDAGEVARTDPREGIHLTRESHDALAQAAARMVQEIYDR